MWAFLRCFLHVYVSFNQSDISHSSQQMMLCLEFEISQFSESVYPNRMLGFVTKTSHSVWCKELFRWQNDTAKRLNLLLIIQMTCQQIKKETSCLPWLIYGCVIMIVRTTVGSFKSIQLCINNFIHRFLFINEVIYLFLFITNLNLQIKSRWDKPAIIPSVIGVLALIEKKCLIIRKRSFRYFSFLLISWSKYNQCFSSCTFLTMLFLTTADEWYLYYHSDVTLKKHRQYLTP